jgi:hypothetical protein
MNLEIVEILENLEADPVLAYFGVARWRMTGDAVPGPLAFFALRQQHENRIADSLRRVLSTTTLSESPVTFDCVFEFDADRV